MANVDSAFGFVPIGTADGSSWRGKLRLVTFAAADSVACFKNDMVKHTGTADSTGTKPVVAQATAAAAIMGAVVDFVPDFTDEGTLTTQYRAASTARDAYVAWGKDVLYIAQEDSDSGSIAAASAGLNASLIVGSGDTTTGISAMEIDSSTAASTSTLELRLHRVYDKIGNAIGSNAIWVVSINNNSDTTTTGT